MLSESQIESLSDTLANLLVAEWKSQHPTHQGSSNPLGELTMHLNTDAESSTYDAKAGGHDPGPTPPTKAQGSLKLVPGSQKRGSIQPDSRGSRGR